MHEYTMKVWHQRARGKNKVGGGGGVEFDRLVTFDSLGGPDHKVGAGLVLTCNKTS